jgi:tetratricopeptide (TPR) repeat protein
VATTDPEPLQQVRPDLPSRVADIVARAMARDPGARHQSAAELRSELEAVQREIRTSETATSWHSNEAVRNGVRSWVQAVRQRRQLRWAIGAVSLAIVALVGVARWNRPPPAPAGETGVPVVAVLPFRNQTGDRANDSLATGFGEVLISSLSRVAELSVVSRAATLPYRDATRDLQRVGRELGATYVVDAGLQRSDERLRVTVNVIRAGSNLVFWSAQFDGTASGVFELQARIAEGLARALELRLSSAQQSELTAPPTLAAGAFGSYSEAMALLERPDVPGNLDRAIELLRAAVAEDRRFALAHAALAEAYWQQYTATKLQTWLDRAVDESQEALRLDAAQPRVRIMLARVLNATGRADAAIEELEATLARYPNDDEALVFLGRLLIDKGKFDEGMARVEQAIRVRPSYWRHHASLGVNYFRAGQLAAAGAAFERVIRLQPDNAWGYQMSGTVKQARGDVEGALLQYQRANSLAPTAETYSNIGTAHFGRRRYPDAIAAYREAVRLAPGEPTYYANLGDAWRASGNAAEARRAYADCDRRAADLIAVNDDDPDALASRGLCAARLGRVGDGDALLQRSVALRPSDPQILYRRAVVLVLARRHEEALDALEQAVARGADAGALARDADLAPLRSSARFGAIVGAAPDPAAKEK